MNHFSRPHATITSIANLANASKLKRICLVALALSSLPVTVLAAEEGGSSSLRVTCLALLPECMDGNEINVYSFRQPQLIKHLTDAFTKQTGVKVNVLFAKSGLLERIKREGRNSPVDVLLTTNFSRLYQAKQRDLVQAVRDPVLEAAVPSDMRDPGGSWYGLTKRARIVYSSRDRGPDAPITYDDITDSRWWKRVCIRSGQHSYNIGLFAWMLAAKGEQYLRDWLIGVKKNLARSPVGNDRAQVKSVYAGRCDIGIGNTYYLGLMQTNSAKPEQQKWAASVKPLFPTLDNFGTHMNISGMALAKYSPNKINAQRFMQWLVSRRAQEIYSDVNFEYPVRVDARVSRLVSSWGTPPNGENTIPLSAVAENVKRASEIVAEVGFDN